MREFYDWCLATYGGKKSERGTLAAYIKADASFPRALRNRALVYGYLKKSGASVPILEAFKGCWDSWLRLRRSADDKPISSIGPTWDEVRPQLYTPEEIAACDARVASIGELIDARERGSITETHLLSVPGMREALVEAANEPHEECLTGGDQAWFWTPAWQEGERRADEDAKAGRITPPMTGDEAVQYLRDRIKPE